MATGRSGNRGQQVRPYSLRREKSQTGVFVIEAVKKYKVVVKWGKTKTMGSIGVQCRNGRGMSEYH